MAAERCTTSDLNRDVNKAFVISQMSTMCMIATVPEAINEKLGVLAYEGPDGGGKMYNITTLARNRVLAGGKVLILSDFLAMQRGLEKEFQRLGMGVIRFKTSWDTEQRQEALEEFASNPEKTIMIAGTRAVSESLDFSAANTNLLPRASNSRKPISKSAPLCSANCLPSGAS